MRKKEKAVRATVTPIVRKGGLCYTDLVPDRSRLIQRGLYRENVVSEH